MTLLTTFKALGPIDVANIRRDSLLRWMALVPFFFAFLFRYVVPWVRDGILERTGFDLAPYYILIVGYGFIIGVPAVFGTVIGFLLLDEKDDQTLTALQVTPITMTSYITYRVFVPILISIGLVLVAYPLAGLVPLPASQIFWLSVLSAPMAPILALFLATFAKNKVQGFAFMKGSGSVLISPLAAFFFTGAWTWIFAIIPTFWAQKLLWVLDSGKGDPWVILVLGLVAQGIILWLLLMRFNRVVRQ
ncbi:MAG: ABC transporter permease [Chloroflexota bacterium]